MGNKYLKNTRRIKINVPGVIVVFCYGKDTFEKYIKKKFSKKETFNHTAHTAYLEGNGKQEIVIGINKFIPNNIFRAICVHEISHAVTMLMNHYDIECDEYRSYAMEYICVEIFKFIKRYKNES